MNVFPDFGGLTGIDSLRDVVGALLTITLLAAVAALIASGVVWAFGASSGNYQLASRGRIGVLVALGVAVMAGGGVALLNWLIGVGQQL
jgi:non-ribosomal peptide synthetase component E (peptide arylation enzyme)